MASDRSWQQFGRRRCAALLYVDGAIKAHLRLDQLRVVAAKLGKTDLYPTDAAARTQVERWMDWLLASLNYHYVAVFKDSKKPEAERAATFAADAKELSAQLEILDKAIAGRSFIAGNSRAFTSRTTRSSLLTARCNPARTKSASRRR